MSRKLPLGPPGGSGLPAVLLLPADPVGLGDSQSTVVLTNQVGCGHYLASGQVVLGQRGRSPPPSWCTLPHKRKQARSSWPLTCDFTGAADGTRTRNNQLGRLTLYQLNYRRVVGATGFEPATLCSQSRCATKLRYAPLVQDTSRHRTHPSHEVYPLSLRPATPVAIPVRKPYVPSHFVSRSRLGRIVGISCTRALNAFLYGFVRIAGKRMRALRAMFGTMRWLCSGGRGGIGRRAGFRFQWGNP